MQFLTSAPNFRGSAVPPPDPAFPSPWLDFFVVYAIDTLLNISTRVWWTKAFRSFETGGENAAEMALRLPTSDDRMSSETVLSSVRLRTAAVLPDTRTTCTIDHVTKPTTAWWQRTLLMTSPVYMTAAANFGDHVIIISISAVTDICPRVSERPRFPANVFIYANQAEKEEHYFCNRIVKIRNDLPSDTAFTSIGLGT